MIHQTHLKYSCDFVRYQKHIISQLYTSSLGPQALSLYRHQSLAAPHPKTPSAARSVGLVCSNMFWGQVLNFIQFMSELTQRRAEGLTMPSVQSLEFLNQKSFHGLFAKSNCSTRGNGSIDQHWSRWSIEVQTKSILDRFSAGKEVYAVQVLGGCKSVWLGGRGGGVIMALVCIYCISILK